MSVTNYFWDMESDNVLMEKNESGGTTAVYTNEPGLYGKLISQHHNGETYFHHYDGSGDTRVVTDENENVVETTTYSAFGEVVEKTSSIVNPFGYKGALGYYANSETSDFYVRARTYQPKIARWLSVDPLVLMVDWNLYVYAANQPTGFGDASGQLHETLTNNPPSLEPCGAFRLVFQWHLHADERDGYIIQRVSNSSHVMNCDGSAIDGGLCPFPKDILDRLEELKKGGILNTGQDCDDYYELWTVDKKGNIWERATPKHPMQNDTDFFVSVGFQSESKGSISKSGQAVFVSKADLQGNLNLAGFTQGAGKGVPSAGILRSTCASPELDSKFATLIGSRTWKSVQKTWACCCCNGCCLPDDQFVRLFASWGNVASVPELFEGARGEVTLTGVPTKCTDC